MQKKWPVCCIVMLHSRGRGPSGHATFATANDFKQDATAVFNPDQSIRRVNRPSMMNEYSVLRIPEGLLTFTPDCLALAHVENRLVTIVIM
jgi:hypothetical protein